LADDGYLFLGFSETLWQIDERFGLVEFPHTFIYKKGIVPEKEISHPFVDIPEFVFEPAPGTVVEITETPLLPPVEREDVAPYIKKALELANAADYEGALSELKKIIGIDNLCLECYYLMGVLLEKTGRLDAAIAEYRRAVYIEPDLSIAYYNLGNIYAFQKKINEAKKAFQNAIKILKSQPADELVHFSDSVSCGLLLTACEKRLEI
jgi:chemotaxis protein methyltransferase CheR